MGVTIAVTRVAAAVDTAPYTQDITTSDLGGLTPKAALFFLTTAITDATPAAHANFCIGAATGATNEWVLAITDEDAQGTTDGGARAEDDACVRIQLPGETGADGAAEFSTFITNGIRINWTNAPAAAYLITVVLFAGTDLLAHADNVSLGDTVDAAVNVTAPSFEPHIVLAVCKDALPINTSSGTAEMSIGLVHNGASITQRAFSQSSRAAQAATVVCSRCTETYGILTNTLGTAALDWGGEFSDFDADGFSVTPRINGANNTSLMYLALNFGPLDSWVGTVDTPTSTGNDAQTGPGLKPQFLLTLLTHMPALDTAYTDANAGSIGVNIADVDDQYCNSYQSEDAQATTDTQSLSDDQLINFPDDSGAAAFAATLASLDANGWTSNYTATQGTAVKTFVLAIEVPAALPIFSDQDIHSLVFGGVTVR